jgi:hypothetical protein
MVAVALEVNGSISLMPVFENKKTVPAINPES